MLLFLYGDGCFGFGRFSEKIGSVSYPEKRLFVAQCVDGVEHRGFLGRVPSEEDACKGADGERKENAPGLDIDRECREDIDEYGGAHADEDADHAARDADQDRFDQELRQNVDSLLIINNENILEIYGRLSLKQAFGKADDILCSAAKGIAEIITVESDLVNVDFADVSKVMRDSGRAHMAVATAEGDNRAETAAEASLRSPLLDHNLISGAKNILLNISVSNADSLMYEEVVRILEYIQAHASVEDESGNIHNANIIWGTSEKPQLGNAIELVVVATGFEGDEEKRMMKTVIPPARIVKPVPEGADPAGKPVLEPVGKPGKATPQTRPLEQVILGEKSTRYSNIDQILAKPAYQSRKAQFIVEMPAGRKEVLKEEKGAAERAEENRSESLFD